jgi:formylglycine-generating enzyme required for sulfatase activity
LAWLSLSTGVACQRGRRSALAEMVAIPGARFEMGCDRGRDPSCSDTEEPKHLVQVAAFRIDRTEVTQGSYGSCIAAGACSPPAGSFDPDFDPKVRPQRPMTQVTWPQAEGFCRWVGKRLPSEAEWEFSARGTDGRIYPWGDQAPTCDRAHTEACGGGPAEVGGRPAGASPFGVLDLAGNVDEWVEDLYRPYGRLYDAGVAVQRVARGGAEDAWHSRSTERSAIGPDYHDALLGFRCAASN